MSQGIEEPADKPNVGVCYWAVVFGLVGLLIANADGASGIGILLLAALVGTSRQAARDQWDADERRHRELLDALARLGDG